MNISEDMIKNLCSDMVYRRGDEYFRDGRVHIKRRSAADLSAVVDGEELYNVYISFDDEKIKSELCTCTYYQTMQSPCKHIVAVLKQQMAEQSLGANIENENDRIAAGLCREFCSRGERERIRASFDIYITSNRGKEAKPEFGLALSLPDMCGRVENLESFLDCYLNYREFKLDRTNVYSRRDMYFPSNEDTIIKIMAEVYQTRLSGAENHRKSLSAILFGSEVMRRVLPYMKNADFKIIFDGININGVRILNEDPDIVIDVEAAGKDITMSISESGFAITQNGDWFFYNDTIYNTTHAWRDCFMPIYRSLSDVHRTQITFKGDNAMLFAAHVMPKLRGRHGVVINGVDEIIVDDKPHFTVFFDCDGDGITAAVTVRYGNMTLRLPSPHMVDDDKIIIRDFPAEERLVSAFEGFTATKNMYKLSGDGAIYAFITSGLKYIGGLAQVVMSDKFKQLEIKDDIPLSVNAAYNEREDYLEISFNSELSREEINGILNSLRENNDFYRTVSGKFIGIKENKKKDLLELLLNAGVTEDDLINGSKRLPKYELLRIDKQNGVVKDESIAEYFRKIRSSRPSVSEDICGTLRKYQNEAVSWFYELSKLDMGGILADDMGLGKTLQTIAYIHSVKPDQPSLIVAPSTLIYNWQREIEKFIPNASYILINGAKDDRKELIDMIDGYEFVITSYPLLRRDINLYMDIEFAYCIIDEAQCIKNRRTLNAVSVKRIRAEHKFALTGTPIENSVMELWSIFDFIMPGYLGSAHQFAEKFDGVSDDVEISQTLRGIIRPFVLRRMKKDVLGELPEKIETTMTAELSREQKGLYQAYVEIAKNEALGLLQNGGERMTILTNILRLRQICSHPSLFAGNEKMQSGKLELLKELVSNAHSGGHRVLVFSQFRSMLDIIEKELTMLGIRCFLINGEVPPEERVQICEKFNAGTGDVVLVSLKAGGTGINLTGADTVIHYDPWWNPAVTDQATDRAYRIGQTRAVQVIKLASRGTIEEKILKLESKKRSLADDIIRINNKTLGSLTDEEIMSLFEMREG